MVYLKESNGEIKFHLKKDTEKVITRLDKKLFSCIKYPFEGHKILCTETIAWQYTA